MPYASPIHLLKKCVIKRYTHKTNEACRHVVSVKRRKRVNNIKTKKSFFLIVFSHFLLFRVFTTVNYSTTASNIWQNCILSMPAKRWSIYKEKPWVCTYIISFLHFTFYACLCAGVSQSFKSRYFVIWKIIYSFIRRSVITTQCNAFMQRFHACRKWRHACIYTCLQLSSEEENSH